MHSLSGLYCYLLLTLTRFRAFPRRSVLLSSFNCRPLVLHLSCPVDQFLDIKSLALQGRWLAYELPRQLP